MAAISSPASPFPFDRKNPRNGEWYQKQKSNKSKSRYPQLVTCVDCGEAHNTMFHVKHKPRSKNHKTGYQCVFCYANQPRERIGKVDGYLNIGK